MSTTSRPGTPASAAHGPAAQPSALVTPAEAAAFLLTTVGTLAQWRYLRRGPAYIKVGRSVAYRLSDLLDYVEQTRVSHNGAAA
ncbi:hypothetical protein JOE58_000762 [Curtobacterium luteum]|uniref:Helix-turn-helix domain-containing protein n=1 Tax=Curtobacterium luteum TaxID=33881 RepID=A0A8H9G7F9_9MICO|nr:hypothetical protein [Curtobacterium luteum]NUU52161.1 helix-turn-helix domain-containing protein [Curtobacterium luteum]GGK89926.1 hypothetical protein GCM10009769_04950 [Curtobacterium luteum]